MNFRMKLALLAFVVMLAIFSVSAAVGGRMVAASAGGRIANQAYQEPETGM